jgi:hypothetical protein
MAEVVPHLPSKLKALSLIPITNTKIFNKNVYIYIYIYIVCNMYIVELYTHNKKKLQAKFYVLYIYY